MFFKRVHTMCSRNVAIRFVGNADNYTCLEMLANRSLEAIAVVNSRMLASIIPKMLRTENSKIQAVTIFRNSHN